MSNSSGGTFISSKNAEPLIDGKNYTLTAMVKAENVTSGEASIKFEIYDANGAHLGDEYASKKVTGTTDYKRLAVEMNADEIKTKYPGDAKFKAVLRSNNGDGYIYFDSIRLEDRGISNTFTYDTKGNYVTSSTDAEGAVTSYTLDSEGKGRVKEIHFPANGSVAKFDYDDLGRVFATEDSSGLRTEIKYDLVGNPTNVEYKDASTGAILSSTSQEYNEFGEITKSTDQLGKITTYDYDEVGNVENIVYPNGKVTNYTYTRLDQLDTVSYATDTTNWKFLYDFNGNMTKSTKKDGTTAIADWDYAYDPKLNQVTNITYPSVNGTRNTLGLEYNPSGMLTSFTSSLDKDANNNSLSVLYDYYPFGNPANTTGSNGQTSNISYDESNRVSKVTTKVGTTSYHTHYEYTDSGLLKKLWQEKADGSFLRSESYSYDGNGNITRIDYHDKTFTRYEYDSSNRLTSEIYYNSDASVRTYTSYTYDAFGNRKTKTDYGVTTNYTYDDANQMLTDDGVTNTYDDNGNTLTNASHSYEYNAADQLKTIKNSSGVSVGNYEYDYEGLRTKKTLSDGSVEHYYYVAGRLTHITDDTNKLKYSFTRNASGMLLSFNDHTGTTAKTYFYVLNHRGDVVGLLDESGNSAAEYKYDAFGNITSSTGTATLGNGKFLKDEQPFRYTSYFYDKESNLYYLKARYYDSSIGRFLSRDPFQNKNLYYYAENNPLKFIDPNGEIAIPLAVPLVKFIGDAVVVGITGYIAFNSDLDSDYQSANIYPSYYYECLNPTIPDPNVNLSKKSVDINKHPWNELPTSGDHPYDPPVNKGGNPVYEKGRDGLIDKDGNEWVWDETGAKVGNPHWDVQHKNGKHTNVNPKSNNPGKVNHGSDNFKNKRSK